MNYDPVFFFETSDLNTLRDWNNRGDKSANFPLKKIVKRVLCAEKVHNKKIRLIPRRSCSGLLFVIVATMKFH